MAKRGVQPKKDPWAAVPLPARARRRNKLPPATIAPTLGLAGCVALCWLVLGPEQPAVIQRLLALGFVGISIALYVVATHQPGMTGETLQRLRNQHHSDFGKQLRERQRGRTVRLPGVGDTSHRFLGGVAVFLLASLWWFTSWAPVRVKAREVQDIAVPLGQTIAAAELVMLDPHTAVCLPPMIPERATSLARLISDGAGAYQLALRATARGQFSDAHALLTTAAEEAQAKPEQISLARAQAYVYAKRFSDAVAEYKNTLARNPDEPMILCQAAVTHMLAGDMRQAEPLIARAGELVRTRLPADDAARGFYLHARALLNLNQGRGYDEAEEYFKQSRDLWEVSLPHAGALAAISRNNQATVCLMRARYFAARELIDWSRESRQTSLGRATALGNLGMLLYVQGDLRGAATQFGLARALLAEETAAVSLPIAAVNRSHLALLHWARGNYDVGRKHGILALRQCDESVGAGHLLFAPMLANLATLYRDHSLYARAEPYYFRALTITRRAHGDQHPYVAAILLGLSRLHLARQNHREAQLAIDRATEVMENVFGDEHPFLIEALNARGELELAMGRARDARRPLERALQILESNYSRKHPLAIRTLGNLAALETSPRTYRRGVALYEEALAMTDAVLGPEHPEAARLHFGLASLYAGRGDHDRAQPAADRCLAIRETVLPAFHPELAAAYDLLADVLENRTKPDSQRAAELRSRAAAIRRRHAQHDRLDTAGG